MCRVAAPAADPVGEDSWNVVFRSKNGTSSQLKNSAQ